MLDEIDKNRRQFIQLGAFLGVTILLTTSGYGDELVDLSENINIQPTNKILAIRIWPANIYTRLTIETDYKIKAKSFTLSNPIRLVIDLQEVKLNLVLDNIKAKILENDKMIQDIKISQYAPYVVRIVMYLKQEIKTQIQNLLPVNLGSVNYKYRYVVDMYQSNKDTDEIFNDDLLALLRLNEQSNENIKLAYGKNFRKKLLIMIDPGHGGEDPGAIGPTGLMEKNVVLNIAEYLYELINQTDYLEARMTRNQDVFIPLNTRVVMARSAKADIFMSIHADAFFTPMAKGSSVFILSDYKSSSSFAKWLAKTQNDADKIGGMTFATKDSIVNKVLLDMTQTWTRKKSDKLGQILLRQLGNITALHNKQVERASFAVLKAPDIPSILVETAFISNPDEEILLKQKDFQEKIAISLFNGINKFIKYS
ncbi:MAG TPA: N-acetylmuramoyl-L-alanine amidase [Burkholderiales bacterium]|nr:N-acetylmuramoyl-L-alanine amidase [Burkholderiales bacterium]